MSTHCATSAAAGPAGDPANIPFSDKALETAASSIQDFSPIKQVCAHLNASHVYLSDPARPSIDVHHYCTHLTDRLRQCLLYDSSSPNARLIGVEYMIPADEFEKLDVDERKLWHSHVFEVKSGMLVMPLPSDSVVPTAAWEKAEMKEMEEVVGWYGKAWHLWQPEKHPHLPLGKPQLMGSYTHETPDWRKVVEERDKKMGFNHKRKIELRQHIPEPKIHPDADHWDHSS